MNEKITLKEKITLLGKDYTIPEETVIESFLSGAIGISIGPAERHWHLEPNEDAGLVVSFEDKTLIAICDAHHGAYASEVVIQTLETSYDRFVNCETQNTFNSILTETVKRSYEIILQTKRDRSYSFPRTATVLLLCLITPSDVYWGSMGDAVLIAQSSNRKPTLINSPQSNAFVGWDPFMSPMAQNFSIEDDLARHLKKGKIDRKSKLQLFMSTDGLVDYYPGKLDAILTSLPNFWTQNPRTIIQKLFQTVIDQEFGDNICSVVVNLSAAI
ncbi:MAG: protein phosphatase 2C domain-containing protein [Candidatus Hodarchaeota archaeon]